MEGNHSRVVQVVQEGAREDLAVVVMVVGELHLSHQSCILDPSVAEDDLVDRGCCCTGDSVGRGD